jgi:hypothetical protein
VCSSYVCAKARIASSAVFGDVVAHPACVAEEPKCGNQVRRCAVASISRNELTPRAAIAAENAEAR